MDNTNSKFYHFNQNNTGGSFHEDEEKGITTDVIIEAKNSVDANKRALELGLYFDGCNDDIDCPCCGDRWYQVGESDGSDVPSIYSTNILLMTKNWFRIAVFVHYLDGTFRKFEFRDEDKTNTE